MIRKSGRKLLFTILVLGFVGISSAHPKAPTNPFEIAAHLEARLASGDGVLMPDATREFVRFAGTVDLEIGDWPQEFRSRAGREICVSVSPVTGFYEFSDGTGDSFWTVVPAVPTAANWVAPLRHADSEPHADDDLFEPWRLVDVWFLSGGGPRSGLSGRAQEPGPPQLRTSEPANPRTSPPEPDELRFTSFGCSEHTLSFVAAWPAGETLPGQILDLYVTTNLSSPCWSVLHSPPAGSSPVSFSLPADTVPNWGAGAPHVHDSTCVAVTNLAVSPLDGTTIYTNILWTCPPGGFSEAAFFRLGTRLDSDGDGLSDAFELLVSLSATNAVDTDLDGLSDGSEWTLGTDPALRDTDGDGIPDSIDPEPLVFDGADADGNGIPDAFETFWFGAVSETPVPTLPDGTGFSLLGKIAASLCPTNAPFESTWPTNRMQALQLVPRFATEWGTDGVIWEKTFPVNRHGKWEQFFVASDPNPLSNAALCDGGAWTLDGMVLEWSDSGGSSGSTNASPDHSTLWLPLSTNDPARLTLRLRTTRPSLSVCPRPLYLLTFVPDFELEDVPAEDRDGTRMAAALVGSPVRYVIDCTGVPSEEPVFPSSGPQLPFGPDARFADTRDPPDGTGRFPGMVVFSKPGLFEIPVLEPQPVLRSRPLLRGPLAPPPREFLLSVLSPFFSWRGYDWSPWWLSYDWFAGQYWRQCSFPLDSYDVWNGWIRDEYGWKSVTYPPELDPGAGELNDWFDTEVTVDDMTHVATGLVLLGNEVVWSNDCPLAVRVNDWETADPAATDCGCGGVDDLEGPSHSSLGFRIPLGDPRQGQISGFLWFRTEEPVVVSNGLFEVLARSDAAVSDLTAAGVRTVVCSDDRGRTVVLEPIQNGVRATVQDTASGALEHVWDVVNENGLASRVRLTKTSRLGNTMSDAVYVHDGSDWSVFDPVANTRSTLSKTDLLDDPDDPVYVEERILADADDPGREYLHSVTTCRRFGEFGSAVLREVERVESPGTAFERVYTTSYWDDSPPHGRRFGLPRLRAGNARAWSWTDYDDRGRPVLSFEPFDGSAVPSGLDDGTRWTLANHPAGLRAIATVRSYDALPGDTNHRDDLGEPRTVSRYLVEGASSNLLSRSWTVIVRDATGPWPSVAVRTERAASQGAAFGAAGNAVSLSVRVDEDAQDVPLSLRGRPLSETDENGVTTSFDYAFGSWDPNLPAFTADATNTHLRCRSLVTTPEAPNGVPLVSTVSETIEDAVHGNEVWFATRVLLADGSFSEPFDWELRFYDEKDRLRSTRFCDGSVATNDYSCCRLLSTVGRDGLRRERLADTGTDHLHRAWLDVSFRTLPRNEPTPVSYGYDDPPAHSYSRTDGFRAVESRFDPLGREILRREMSTRPDRSRSIETLRPAYKGWDSAETNLYPFGTSDFRIRTDGRGLRTETRILCREDREETTIDGYDGTNLLDRTVSRRIRGGGSDTRRVWDGGWTESRTRVFYGPDGCRTDVSVTESSDAPPVTNSVSVSDFLGRTVRVVTPLSDSTYVYDGASSRVLSVFDAVSGTSSATLYDALREPVGSLGSDGVSSVSTTRFECDASNVWWRVGEEREAAGGATNLLSTVRERLTGLSDARRSETVAIHAGGPVSVTTVSFDPATLVSVETNRSDGLAPFVRRSKFGRTVEETERDGTVRRFFFDPYGRTYLSGDQAPGGSIVWRNWTIRDDVGDVVGEVEITGHWPGPAGLATNLTAFIFSNGTYKWNGFLTQHGYDVRGNLVATWNPEGKGVFSVRDGIGRIVQTYGAATHPSARLLDTAGRLEALGTTRAGNVWDVTQWGWDFATGLCTNKTYADGSTVVSTFTADGLPLRKTLASGRWTQNAYDAARRLSATADSDGNSVQFAYDAFGRQVAATESTGRSETFARNAFGLVTNETQTVFGGTLQTNRTAVLDRSLDAFGRPAGLSLKIDGDFAQSVCYDYGMDGRLSGMVLTNAQGRSVSVGFDRDRGRPVRWTVSDASGATLFGRTATRAPRRPALATAVTNAGVAVRSFAYAYDAVGRPVTRNADAFAYNARGEVTNAMISTGVWNYAYDHIGNRTAATDVGATTAYTANEVNQYTAVGTTDPQYDLDGNLVAFGNCTNAWNAAGQLVSTTWTETNGLKRLRNEYDYRGRRIRRVSETSADGGLTWTVAETRDFVYDDWNLLFERSERPSEGAAELAFFWGPDLSDTLQGAGGVGGLMAVSVGGDFYFPGYDNNGNVIGYWDESGSLVAEYAYDAFGNTIAKSGLMASVFPHRFSTKYHDPETDLYYYGYRYYSPNLGRWISRDLIEEKGGLSLYAFVFNCPEVFVDSIGDFGLASLVAMFLGAVGIEYDFLNAPTWLNDSMIAHYGGPDPFMDATQQELREKGGTISEELFKKARRKSTTPINGNSIGIDKRIYNDLRKIVKNSQLYKEKKQFIIKRLGEGTLYTGFINIEFHADQDNKPAYSLGGAQLHYSYDPKTKQVSLWIEDTYDFKKKNHVWERLHELGYIEYFDENIAIEVIDCPNVAPEVKSK